METLNDKLIIIRYMCESILRDRTGPTDTLKLVLKSILEVING